MSTQISIKDYANPYGFIYEIKNKINNKKYIGQTIGTIENRWKRHLRSVKNGEQYHLYNSMRKYGIEKFFIKLLDEKLIKFLLPILMRGSFSEEIGVRLR